MANREYKLDILKRSTENLQDYIDVICEDEIDRQSLSLKVAFDMILCACPYVEEEDITLVSEEFINRNMVALQQSFSKYIKDQEENAKNAE